VQASQPRPYIVTVVPDTPAEARSTTVSDVLIGSVGLAGLMLGVALVLGVVFGGLRLAVRRYFPSGEQPPITSYEPDSRQPPP
jgi:hypothetical protein